MIGMRACGRRPRRIATALAGASIASGACAAVHVDRVVVSAATLVEMPVRVNGRTMRVAGDGGYVRQWPGTYFEAGFYGKTVLFRVGRGDVILHILVDDRTVQTLVKPMAGQYRIMGLSAGRHRLRVEVATESQAGPTIFGGFFADRGTRTLVPAQRSRQIEFIGDSHTVGYGDLSVRRECTEDEIWATTDTSRGFGATLARRYDADYQVNAISGRGVVRNYNGFAADALPDVYPYALFDKRSPANDPNWHPQVIVIALGTNDFTTPLHASEKWPTRDALHLDYEARYTRFVRDLRARNPSAWFVLWATDMANGEIESEVGKVVTALRAAGERRITFVPISGLAFAACNSHPSLADQQVIADKLGTAITASVGWVDQRSRQRR
jgi:lysophospholipase L1-like esterase